MTTRESNHWFDDRCAKAFRDQHHALPYQELLKDTTAWLGPRPGETWIDLGCGSGHLAGALWQESRGQVACIHALDAAAANARAIARLRARLVPPADEAKLPFRQARFSDGLGMFDDQSIDGVVSGLALSYAEHREPKTGTYTLQGYERILEEVFRVLRPGGRLVFSVNVPEPDFWRIFWKSLSQGFRLSRPARALVNALRMLRYGGWLKREARRGRFNFLPLPALIQLLQRVGFRQFRVRLSYAGQAYVLSAARPAVAAVHAA